MLAPKRIKFRKRQKGRNRGKACRGNEVSFGDFGLQATEAVGIIIEVSGLDVIDVEEFDALRKTMVMVQLMGAKTVIAGLRPGVVSSLVQLDAATDEVDAAMNLDDAFERIEALVAGDGDEVEE